MSLRWVKNDDEKILYSGSMPVAGISKRGKDGWASYPCRSCPDIQLMFAHASYLEAKKSVEQAFSEWCKEAELVQA